MYRFGERQRHPLLAFGEVAPLVAIGRHAWPRKCFSG
jgi:hypothetical protein